VAKTAAAEASAALAATQERDSIIASLRASLGAAQARYQAAETGLAVAASPRQQQALAEARSRFEVEIGEVARERDEARGRAEQMAAALARERERSLGMEEKLGASAANAAGSEVTLGSLREWRLPPLRSMPQKTENGSYLALATADGGPPVPTEALAESAAAPAPAMPSSTTTPLPTPVPTPSASRSGSPSREAPPSYLYSLMANLSFAGGSGGGSLLDTLTCNLRAAEAALKEKAEASEKEAAPAPSA